MVFRKKVRPLVFLRSAVGISIVLLLFAAFGHFAEHMRGLLIGGAIGILLGVFGQLFADNLKLTVD